MILYTERRSLYSPCQEVISMHKIYLSSRCLQLMETNYIDGGKEPNATQLRAITDYFTDRFPSKFLLKSMFYHEG